MEECVLGPSNTEGGFFDQPRWSYQAGCNPTIDIGQLYRYKSARKFLYCNTGFSSCSIQHTFNRQYCSMSVFFLCCMWKLPLELYYFYFIMNKRLQYIFIKCKPLVETIEVFIYVRESLFYQQYKKCSTPVCTYTLFE